MPSGWPLFILFHSDIIFLRVYLLARESRWESLWKRTQSGDVCLVRLRWYIVFRALNILGSPVDKSNNTGQQRLRGMAQNSEDGPVRIVTRCPSGWNVSELQAMQVASKGPVSALQWFCPGSDFNLYCVKLDNFYRECATNRGDTTQRTHFGVFETKRMSIFFHGFDRSSDGFWGLWTPGDEPKPKVGTVMCMANTAPRIHYRPGHAFGGDVCWRGWSLFVIWLILEILRAASWSRIAGECSLGTSCTSGVWRLRKKWRGHFLVLPCSWNGLGMLDTW